MHSSSCRKEDGFFVFDEAAGMARGALDQQKAGAARDLEALVGELILVGLGEEAEIDLRSPNPLAIGIRLKFPFAIHGFELGRSEGTLPRSPRAGDDDGQASLGEPAEKLAAVIVG